MPNLRARATDPELLDEGVPEAEAVLSLGDLRFVNRWLGGRRSLRRAATPLISRLELPTLLDVGCGSADLPHPLQTDLRHRLRPVALDINSVHPRQPPPGMQRIMRDARRPPFPPLSSAVGT